MSEAPPPTVRDALAELSALRADHGETLGAVRARWKPWAARPAHHGMSLLTELPDKRGGSARHNGSTDAPRFSGGPMSRVMAVGAQQQHSIHFETRKGTPIANSQFFFSFISTNEFISLGYGRITPTWNAVLSLPASTTAMA